MTTVRVRVERAEDGAPIEGAEVAAKLPFPRTPGPTQFVRLRTDRAGGCAFELEAVGAEPPSFKIFAAASGRAAETSFERIEPWPRLTAAPFEIVLRLRTGTTLEGRVVDRAGRPVAGARIDVARERPAYCSWGRLLGGNSHGRGEPTSSDADGRFAVLDVDWGGGVADVPGKGVLALEVAHPDFAPWRMYGLEQIAACGTEIAQIGVCLEEGRTCSGIVTGPDGTSIPGAEVGIHVYAPNGNFLALRAASRSAIADAAGRFRFHGLLDAVHELRGSAAGYAARSGLVDLGRASAPSVAVVLQPDPAGLPHSVQWRPPREEQSVRVAFRLVAAEDGAPLPIGPFVPGVMPAQVFFDGKWMSKGVMLLPGVELAATIAPGAFTVTADVDGRALAVRKVEIPPDGFAEPLVLAVSRGIAVRGVAGAGATVEYRGPHGNRDHRFASADASGAFLLRGAAESGVLLLRAPGFAPVLALVRDLPERAPGIREFCPVLDAGVTYEGRVLRPDGRPEVAALVQARYHDPLRWHLEPGHTATDSAGRYRLERAPAGELVLATLRGERTVHGSAGETHRIDF